MNTLEKIIQEYNLHKSAPMAAMIEVPNVDRVSMMELFHKLGFTRGVEVGTERGVFAKQICQAIPGIHLSCVDPWLAYSGYREHVSQGRLDDFYEITKDRLKDYNVDLIRKYSADAVEDFEDGELDFVYIDGNHEYRHTVNDIALWTPKVRDGGIVAGHDYIKRKNPDYLMGVVPAVNGFVEAYAIQPLFIFGRKDKVEGEKRDRNRSWMFVKERNPYANPAPETDARHY